MANLFWRRPTGPVLNLLSVPFKTEAEFEETVFKTKDILGDVYPLQRQLRGGRKPGIPDILGVDSDGNVCIVELKNVTVNALILPQVLQYAFWAESNPDSIKNIWYEAKDRPEDVVIDFGRYDVRIIVIAPDVDRSALALVSKVNYRVDLIEVKRWQAETGDEFLLVNVLDPEKVVKSRPVQGLATYDREFYETQFNKTSVGHFFRYVDDTTRLIKQSGWALEPKFNKYYCGFKYGFFNAFGIKWLGSKSLAFFFKLPENVARRLASKTAPMARYDSQWSEAVFKIEPGVTKVEAFLPLMTACVKAITHGK